MLDVLKDLPYIRQAIFSDESLSEGEKIHHEARYKGCASLTEEEGRKQLMLFFKSAAKQARLEGDSLAARRLEAATPHTFRASELCILARAHTHTHIHVCVCMCVCVCVCVCVDR